MIEQEIARIAAMSRTDLLAEIVKMTPIVCAAIARSKFAAVEDKKIAQAISDRLNAPDDPHGPGGDVKIEITRGHVDPMTRAELVQMIGSLAYTTCGAELLDRDIEAALDSDLAGGFREPLHGEVILLVRGFTPDELSAAHPALNALLSVAEMNRDDQAIQANKAALERIASLTREDLIIELVSKASSEIARRFIGADIATIAKALVGRLNANDDRPFDEGFRLELPASPEGSRLVLHTERCLSSARFIVEQKPYSGVEAYWKPNEVELDVDTLRALRDTCTKIIDKIHEYQLDVQ